MSPWAIPYWTIHARIETKHAGGTSSSRLGPLFTPASDSFDENWMRQAVKLPEHTTPVGPMVPLSPWQPGAPDARRFGVAKQSFNSQARLHFTIPSEFDAIVGRDLAQTRADVLAVSAQLALTRLLHSIERVERQRLRDIDRSPSQCVVTDYELGFCLLPAYSLARLGLVGGVTGQVAGPVILSSHKLWLLCTAPVLAASYFSMGNESGLFVMALTGALSLALPQWIEWHPSTWKAWRARLVNSFAKIQPKSQSPPAVSQPASRLHVDDDDELLHTDGFRMVVIPVAPPAILNNVPALFTGLEVSRSNEITDHKGFYRLLNCDPTASTPQLRRAFQRIFRAEALDMGPDAQRRFKLIMDAHKTLMDPLERAKYDRTK
jgi:hypothetical protein